MPRHGLLLERIGLMTINRLTLFFILLCSLADAQTAGPLKVTATGQISGPVTASAFATANGLSTGGGAVWGDITGTLSAQSDLQTALTAKLSLNGNGSALTGLTWSQIGSTPTTLAGYGITDPIVLTSGSYANPAWITSLAYSKLTSAPSSLVNSFNTRTGAVTLQAADLALSGAALTALPSSTGLYPTLNQNTSGSAGSVGSGTYLPYLTSGVPGAATSSQIQSAIGASVYDAYNANTTHLGNATTGSGSIVLGASPTLTTPALGIATATSINGNTITTGTGTLTLGTATLNVGAGGTLGSNAFTSTAFVPQTTTVNGHALSGNVVVLGTDITTGMLSIGVIPIGTTSSTVAAGNDSRINGALQTSALGAGVQTSLTSATNATGGVVTTAPYYGTIFSASSFTNLSAFTINGITASVSSNQINISGGSGTYAKSLDYNYFTTLPRWACGATFQAGSITSSSYGLGVGPRSANTFTTYSTLGSVNLSTGGTGNLTIQEVANGSGSILATAATSLSFSAGDYIYEELDRFEDTVYFWAYDVTTQSAVVSVSYQFSTAYSQSALVPNTGKFALWAFGGTQNVSSFSIRSLSPKNPDVVLIGDSKISGYYSGNYGQSFAALIQNDYRSVTLAGPGDTTTEVLLRMPEILAENANSYVLNIGRNDIAKGTSLGTIEANYASIVSQIQATGRPVYNLLPLYETVVDQSALTAWIQATYPSAYIIDGGGANYAGTVSNILAGDNIHPNAFFHNKIYEAIKTTLGQTNPRFVSYAQNGTQIFSQGYSPTIGITNSALAAMAANTVKANITGLSATPTDVTKANFDTWLGLDTGTSSQVRLGNGTYGTYSAPITVQTGTLIGGASTKTVPSGCHPWVQDTASSLTNVGSLVVTVSGTTATVTSTNPLDTSPYSLYNAGSQ